MTTSTRQKSTCSVKPPPPSSPPPSAHGVAAAAAAAQTSSSSVSSQSRSASGEGDRKQGVGGNWRGRLRVCVRAFGKNFVSRSRGGKKKKAAKGNRSAAGTTSNLQKREKKSHRGWGENTVARPRVAVDETPQSYALHDEKDSKLKSRERVAQLANARGWPQPTPVPNLRSHSRRRKQKKGGRHARTPPSKPAGTYLVLYVTDVLVNLRLFQSELESLTLGPARPGHGRTATVLVPSRHRAAHETGVDEQVVFVQRRRHRLLDCKNQGER